MAIRLDLPSAEFAFEILAPDDATAADDRAIRRLLGATDVPGRVALATGRAPTYFEGCAPMGPFCHAVVARHRPTGEIVGLCARSARPRFVNGRVEEVGYIAHLRVDPRFRGRWLVPRFLRVLRRVHADGRVAGYLSVIAPENAVARGLVVDRPRGGFPAFRPVARLRSLAVIPWPPRPALPAPEDVRPGSPADLDAIVAALRRYGAAKQFFPAYTVDDFRPGAGLTRGFRVEDFVVARRRGEVVGVIGLWDCSGHKPTIVRAYSPPLRMLRPAYNLAARLVRAPRLPPPGRPLPYAYAGFVAVADDDPRLFGVLLRRVYNLAAARGYAFLVIDLDARDPLLAVARRYPHLGYDRALYTVCYTGPSNLHDRLDGRLAYVETASL